MAPETGRQPGRRAASAAGTGRSCPTSVWPPKRLCGRCSSAPPSRCQPDKYGHWKNITWDFDPTQLMCRRACRLQLEDGRKRNGISATIVHGRTGNARSPKCQDAASSAPSLWRRSPHWRGACRPRPSARPSRRAACAARSAKAPSPHPYRRAGVSGRGPAVRAGGIGRGGGRSGALGPVSAARSRLLHRSPARSQYAPALPGLARLNAQALVVGRASRAPDGRVVAEFRLWDVFSGRSWHPSASPWARASGAGSRTWSPTRSISA